MSKFKAGDKVRVLQPTDRRAHEDDEGHYESFPYEMDQYIGGTFVIEAEHPINGYFLSGIRGWGFLSHWLEPVK